MKFLSLLAAASIALTVGAGDVSADAGLVGKALEKRLTHTQMTLRPVGRKVRKGEATRHVITLLPAGKATWETNGQYAREGLWNWRIRGNLLCFENANQRFIDKRRRDRGQKVRKRDKYANCSALGLKGSYVTMYAPQGSFNRNWALTGRIKAIWP